MSSCDQAEMKTAQFILNDIGINDLNTCTCILSVCIFFHFQKTDTDLFSFSSGNINDILKCTNGFS